MTALPISLGQALRIAHDRPREGFLLFQPRIHRDSVPNFPVNLQQVAKIHINGHENLRIFGKPKPFVWTKTAEDILASGLSRLATARFPT